MPPSAIPCALERALVRAAGVAVTATVALVSCSAPPAPDKPDEPPVAVAGPDLSVASGVQVTLDGSTSSDPDGDSLAFRWSQSEDNPARVALSDTRLVSFPAPAAPGDYLFVLTVTARQLDSAPDSVRVTVLGSDNHPPVARAGIDYTARLGSVFFLDGSSTTDADGDTLTFLWEVVEAAGAATIDDASAVQTRFTPAAAGAYTFRLSVGDGALTATDEVVVLITAAGNRLPQADAGPKQTVAVGSLVTLDGTGSSDPDGDTLSYHWSVGNNPGEAVALSDTAAATPTFTPNLLGDYVFGLVVHDGRSASLLDTAVVAVVARTYNQRSGMIEVPAGPFAMGSESGLAGETPVHAVQLSAFWIDSVEVSAADFAQCVNSGGCSPPSQQPGCNYGLDERADHPINCVDYRQAAEFCAWAGKRLPTEAEWEKAARGPNDQRRFPWGDQDPTLLLLGDPSLRLLNFNNLIGTTAPVGQHPDGVSPYGVHDLAGNVMEWVADWYDLDYYATSAAADPPGPATGQLRVARGGDYLATREVVTVSVRSATQPSSREPVLGFRCARTTSPP